MIGSNGPINRFCRETIEAPGIQANLSIDRRESVFMSLQPSLDPGRSAGSPAFGDGAVGLVVSPHLVGKCQETGEV
jgi:hypothetical protein